MSVINYKKFIFILIISSFLLFGFLGPSSAQPVLREIIYIKPTIQDRSTIHFKIDIYNYQPQYTNSVVLGVPSPEHFSIKNVKMELRPELTDNVTITWSLASYLSEENNENNRISTYFFELVFDNAVPSSMNLTLEFDITGLHLYERAMFPFDEYDSEIRFIFPISDAVELESLLFSCETEDDTIEIIYPSTKSQQKLPIKNSNEMEYGGTIYSDLFIFENNWQWCAVNVTFSTDLIYHISTLFALDVVLILLLIIGISAVLIENNHQKRINFIALIGVTACFILTTGLINYNQMLPNGVTSSLGHVFMIFGTFAFVMGFLFALLFAKRGVKLNLVMSSLVITFLFYFTFENYSHLISINKVFWHIGAIIFVFGLPAAIYFLTQIGEKPKHSRKWYTPILGWARPKRSRRAALASWIKRNLRRKK